MLNTRAKGYPPGQLRPEWSKVWAFTPNGPWTESTIISGVPKAYDPLTFQWAKKSFAKCGPAKVFTKSFLDQLFA